MGLCGASTVTESSGCVENMGRKDISEAIRNLKVKKALSVDKITAVMTKERRGV